MGHAVQVDAFADAAFTGNPAAVCLLEGAAARALPDKTLQQIAAENNLAETAFVYAKGESGSEDFVGASKFDLRWFTPAVEVDLCGHATLAAAAVLFQGVLPAAAFSPWPFAPGLQRESLAVEGAFG